jgi:hypothetical protein
MESEPTLVSPIIFADMVIRELGTGKPSLIGCFHQFAFPQLPARIGRFFTMISVTNMRGEMPELHATCRIDLAQNAQPIASVSAKLALDARFQPLTPKMIFDIPFPFANVTFPSAGQYVVVVLINTEEVARRNFDVATVTAPANPT